MAQKSPECFARREGANTNYDWIKTKKKKKTINALNLPVFLRFSQL